jgi:hypothetical protein
LPEFRESDDLFEDELLITVLWELIILSNVLLHVIFRLLFTYYGVMLCHPDKLLKQRTLEVTLFEYLVDQVFDKVLRVYRIFVALDHLRNQHACFYTVIDHIKKEVQLWKQEFLARDIRIAKSKQEIYDCLE